VNKPVIGLALGGGSARGWSHIGVIRELMAAGIEPDIVAGTSIGSLVGAAYAAGELDRLQNWLESLTRREVVRLLDISGVGGLIKGDKLVEFFASHFQDTDIEKLPKSFGAVATDLVSGNEVWLRNGSVIEAVRASIAVPGLFTPVARNAEILVDGGLVNPVPVSLCRAMGGEFVIAVDLNSDMAGRHFRSRDDMTHEESEKSSNNSLGVRTRLQSGFAVLLGSKRTGRRMPAVRNIITSSIGIMQVQITRSRFAIEPPDALITPLLSHMSLTDFHRATIAIAEGRNAVRSALPQLADRLAHHTRSLS
jgi:NTE family protein